MEMKIENDPAARIPEDRRSREGEAAAPKPARRTKDDIRQHIYYWSKRSKTNHATFRPQGFIQQKDVTRLPEGGVKETEKRLEKAVIKDKVWQE